MRTKLASKISMLLVVCLCLTFLLPSIGMAYRRSNPDIEIESITNDKVLRKLEEYGLADKEIVSMYQEDANRFGVKIKLPERLSARVGIQELQPLIVTRSSQFPSNPREGDRYTIMYDVNYHNAFNRAGLFTGGVGTVAAALVAYAPGTIIAAIASAIGPGVALFLLAESIYYYLRSNQHNGVRGTRTYVYGRNNDGLMEWIYIYGSETKYYY